MKINSIIAPTKSSSEAGFSVGRNYKVVHINKGSGSPKIVNDYGNRITINRNYIVLYL